MKPCHVASLLWSRTGVFVGGDTASKLTTVATWALLAHDYSAICHVGRVNSVRLILLCTAAGIDSFEGSGSSRFAKKHSPSIAPAANRISKPG